MPPFFDLPSLSRRAEQEAIMAIASPCSAAADAHDSICRSYCALFRSAMRAPADPVDAIA
ncbi:hypothetical protein KY084_03860 [Stakelama sp. CBK3Z-3]|uniref:Uncharacterized protein n=1 Tax=Stakelama flava TaxID=2860338 RepID=A0ABS6XII7_9SPHN|nr:hypothetical protein [Stakelama flava]MBW4330007.1 hypothetical protein [Stakelama flava]